MKKNSTFSNIFGKLYFTKLAAVGKDLKNYYSYTTACDNCKTYVEVHIKKGVTIKAIRGSIVCETCGCHLEKNND